MAETIVHHNGENTNVERITKRQSNVDSGQREVSVVYYMDGTENKAQDLRSFTLVNPDVAARIDAAGRSIGAPWAPKDKETSATDKGGD